MSSEGVGTAGVYQVNIEVPFNKKLTPGQTVAALTNNTANNQNSFDTLFRGIDVAEFFTNLGPAWQETRRVYPMFGIVCDLLQARKFFCSDPSKHLIPPKSSPDREEIIAGRMEWVAFGTYSLSQLLYFLDDIKAAPITRNVQSATAYVGTKITFLKPVTSMSLGTFLSTVQVVMHLSGVIQKVKAYERLSQELNEDRVQQNPFRKDAVEKEITACVWGMGQDVSLCALNVLLITTGAILPVCLLDIAIRVVTCVKTAEGKLDIAG